MPRQIWYFCIEVFADPTLPLKVRSRHVCVGGGGGAGKEGVHVPLVSSAGYVGCATI